MVPLRLQRHLDGRIYIVDFSRPRRVHLKLNQIIDRCRQRDAIHSMVRLPEGRCVTCDVIMIQTLHQTHVFLLVNFVVHVGVKQRHQISISHFEFLSVGCWIRFVCPCVHTQVLWFAQWPYLPLECELFQYGFEATCGENCL